MSCRRTSSPAILPPSALIQVSVGDDKRHKRHARGSPVRELAKFFHAELSQDRLIRHDPRHIGARHEGGRNLVATGALGDPCDRAAVSDGELVDVTVVQIGEPRVPVVLGRKISAHVGPRQEPARDTAPSAPLGKRTPCRRPPRSKGRGD